MKWLRLVGWTYRTLDRWTRPGLFWRQKRRVLSVYPQLAPLLEAFERHYIRVEFSAHDLSLQERIRRKMSEDREHIYGTTPWLTLLELTRELTFAPDEVFVELGCGTGHFCFFMQQVYSIRAIGLETLNTFVGRAKQIMCELSGPPHQLDLSQLQFFNLDLKTFNFSRGSFFYTTWTCFAPETRATIQQKFIRDCQPGARLLVISHAAEDPRLKLLRESRHLFSWGWDTARLYELQAESSA
jgi:SAM-dependent methyltransferase